MYDSDEDEYPRYGPQGGRATDCERARHGPGENHLANRFPNATSR